MQLSAAGQESVEKLLPKPAPKKQEKYDVAALKKGYDEVRAQATAMQLPGFKTGGVDSRFAYNINYVFGRYAGTKGYTLHLSSSGSQTDNDKIDELETTGERYLKQAGLLGGDSSVVTYAESDGDFLVFTILFTTGPEKTSVFVRGGPITGISVPNNNLSVASLRAAVLDKFADSPSLEFLAKKKYIGYPVNITKKVYKIFRRSYNDLINNTVNPTADQLSQIGNLKILTNLYRKLAGFSEAQKFNTNSIPKLIKYVNTSEGSKTGTAAKLRKIIKAKARNAIQVISEAKAKDIAKAIVGRQAAMIQNQKNHATGDAMKLLKKEEEKKPDANQNNQQQQDDGGGDNEDIMLNNANRNNLQGNN